MNYNAINRNASRAENQLFTFTGRVVALKVAEFACVTS